MKITNDQLRQIYPHSTQVNRDKYLPFMNDYFEEYEVNTIERMAAYLAQIGHESGQLRYVEEIASGKAYEWRKDLGNIHPGDGVKYKGRGLIQVTGRANYEAFDRWVTNVPISVDFIGTPELLTEPEYAVLSSFWYWTTRTLNRYATLKEDDFKTLTKRINGGLNGYADRFDIWTRAKNTLSK